MAYTLYALEIDGMSPISFEIMLSAINSMDYYYGEIKSFERRKQEAIEWLERSIEKMRDVDARIPKRKIHED